MRNVYEPDYILKDEYTNNQAHQEGVRPAMGRAIKQTWDAGQVPVLHGGRRMLVDEQNTLPDNARTMPYADHQNQRQEQAFAPIEDRFKRIQAMDVAGNNDPDGNFSRHQRNLDKMAMTGRGSRDTFTRQSSEQRLGLDPVSRQHRMNIMRMENEAEQARIPLYQTQETVRGQMHVANQGLAGTQYQADRNLDGTRYTADQNYEGVAHTVRGRVREQELANDAPRWSPDGSAVYTPQGMVANENAKRGDLPRDPSVIPMKLPDGRTVDGWVLVDGKPVDTSKKPSDMSWQEYMLLTQGQVTVDDLARLRGVQGGGQAPQGGGPAPQGGGSGPREGQTATNPSTGERMVYQNGAWVPMR